MFLIVVGLFMNWIDVLINVIFRNLFSYEPLMQSRHEKKKNVQSSEVQRFGEVGCLS